MFVNAYIILNYCIYIYICVCVCICICICICITCMYYMFVYVCGREALKQSTKGQQQGVVAGSRVYLPPTKALRFPWWYMAWSAMRTCISFSTSLIGHGKVARLSQKPPMPPLHDITPLHKITTSPESQTHWIYFRIHEHRNMIGNWARNGAHVFGWAFPSRCFAKKILALSAWPLMAARGILLKRGMRTPTSQDPVQNLSSKRLQKTPRGPYKGCRCFLFF